MDTISEGTVSESASRLKPTALRETICTNQTIPWLGISQKPHNSLGHRQFLLQSPTSTEGRVVIINDLETGTRFTRARVLLEPPGEPVLLSPGVNYSYWG